MPEGYPGDVFVDVISVDVYLPEYEATDYHKEYEELINNTTKNKVAALAEVGYLPDIRMLEKSHILWALYFCMVADDTSPMLQAKYPSDQKILFFQYCLDRKFGYFCHR